MENCPRNIEKEIWFERLCFPNRNWHRQEIPSLIDEINRGEISKILENSFSIDKGYRGEKGSVSTQYANLHETDEKFYIPWKCLYYRNYEWYR